MRKIKPLKRAIIGTALLATGVTPVAAQPMAGDLQTLDSVFVSQAGDTVAAQYGFLWVPENRSSPEGRMVRLGYVRFPSTASEPGPPIVYLAGGPGGSGIDAARGNRFPLFMQLRQGGDVIALAQRGTRGSIPHLACQFPWIYPTEQALTRETFLQSMLEWSQLCADYWRGVGIDLTAYNTVENADDVEDLRVALGADRVSLFGISYGTHLALSVLRRHPGSVHRAVLAGVEGPDQTLKLPSTVEATLARVDSLVRADSAASARYPDFLGSVRAVLDTLDSSAVSVETQDPATQESALVTVGAFDVQWLTAGSIGSSQILSQLPFLFERLSAGEYSIIAPFVLGSRSRNMLAMTFAMDCSSSASPERLERIRREETETLLGDAVDFPLPYVCDAWPHAQLGEDFRAPVRSDVPVQFISGTLDGRTPVENAAEVRSGFPNSGHLVLEGAAHSDDLLLSSPRISQIALDFLTGGPPVDERVVVPFRIFVPE
jgi:pimeloyl-ACP methyl ester carboxylesterase